MKITIIGTGAYGIALASSLYQKNKINLWTKFEKECEELLTTRVSKKLNNYTIPKEINITSDVKYIDEAELVIIAVPGEFVESTLNEIKNHFNKKQYFVIATKGIDEKSGRFIFEILNKCYNTNKYAVISGPSFAKEIVTGNPIGLSLASKNKETIKIITGAFSNSNIKLRPTSDIVGISICGAIKNIIAIASGMLEGIESGNSTRAMLITESLHDIKSMIKKLGGSGKSILSFAGFGDLLLTCTSEESRNFSFGKLLSTGTEEEINKYRTATTIEGLYTLKSVYKLLRNKKVSIPIINLIYNIVYKNVDTHKLLSFLMEKE